MSNSITIKGSVIASQIQQGGTESFQINEDGFDISECQKLLDMIEGYRPLFDKEFGDESNDLKNALDSAQNAINTKSHLGWKKAISVIKDILVGCGSSLLAAGILKYL